MKIRAFSLILTAMECVSFPVRAGDHINLQENTRTREILVISDPTVKDRSGLSKRLLAFETRLLRAVETNPKTFDGGHISLQEVTDNGDNEPLFTVELPRGSDPKKKRLKRAMYEFDQQMAAYLKQLKKPSRTYGESRHLEVIQRALEDFNEIYIISDMALVDRATHRNFERGVLGRTINLSALTKGKFITYFRLALPGISAARIHAIEKWWDTSLFGSGRSRPSVLPL